MMSTWEELDDTTFDEETKEEEEANLCLMADIASKRLDSKLDKEIYSTITRTHQSWYQESGCSWHMIGEKCIF